MKVESPSIYETNLAGSQQIIDTQHLAQLHLQPGTSLNLTCKQHFSPEIFNVKIFSYLFLVLIFQLQYFYHQLFLIISHMFKLFQLQIIVLNIKVHASLTF